MKSLEHFNGDVGMLSLWSSKGYKKLYYTSQEHKSLSKHKPIAQPSTQKGRYIFREATPMEPW
jgi:hypothetical protein